MAVSSVRCDASKTPESPATLSSLTAADTEGAGRPAATDGDISEIGESGGDLPVADAKGRIVHASEGGAS